MKIPTRLFTKILIISCLLTVWLWWDFSQASKQMDDLNQSFKLLSEFDATTSATTTVAIVRSDNPELSNPTPITDDAIAYNQIEDIVRKAIELAGGFDWVIRPGDMVLLKPNIVDPEPPGSGEVTDVRVIKALIKIIDEIDPGNMDIVVGEGSPREMDYELKYSSRTSPRWTELWDVAGYQELLTDPLLEGINFRLSNLNGSPPENPWQDLVEVDVPNGGQADPQGGKYWIHKDVLDADVYITVPVMKIHNPGITVALKNQIGLAPCSKYGFSKNAGVPQDNYQHRLHTYEEHKYWTDKEIVDLSHLAQIKYTVVDAIACLEREKGARRSGGVITNLVRMNSIIAGPDPVAVDHVCSRLMGLNPHDISHVTLAEKVGLGTNDPDNINIVGADFEQTQKRFIKSPDPAAEFGESNRVWLLKGPYSIDGVTDPINYAFIENEKDILPIAGKNGWSEPIYFREDWIDLEDYFNLSSSDDVVSYAFSYFDAPNDQQAELWIGSDEALTIYINGNEVYSYTGNRSLNGYYSEIVKTQIKTGENTLLIKSLQKYGRYEFTLNICEPETDPNFNGNRIWGLEFKTKSNVVSVSKEHETSPVGYKIYNAYPNPFNGSVKLSYQMKESGRMSISVFNILGEKVYTLCDNKANESGEHMIYWNGLDDTGNPVPSGTYFVAFQKEGHTRYNQKILYLK